MAQFGSIARRDLRRRRCSLERMAVDLALCPGGDKTDKGGGMWKPKAVKNRTGSTGGSLAGRVEDQSDFKPSLGALVCDNSP